MHTAKFEAERETENIRKKVHEYGIKHPVVNDANQVIWNRFGVNSWPTLVLIDAKGEYLGSLSGEGHYEVLDRVIGELVKKHRANNELSTVEIKFFPESEKPHTGPLLFPGKVLADAKGKRLFVSDTGHNRIVMTDLEGKNADDDRQRDPGAGRRDLRQGRVQPPAGDVRGRRHPLRRGHREPRDPGGGPEGEASDHRRGGRQAVEPSPSARARARRRA